MPGRRQYQNNFLEKINMSVWKKIKATRKYKKTKRLLKQIIGKDLWLSTQVKVNTIHFGDWCFCPDNINDKSVIYSLGVGEDIFFDRGIIDQFGADVHAFDPTPNTINWLESIDISNKYKFHPFGIANADEALKIYPRVNKRGRKSKSMFTVVNEGQAGEGIDVQMHRLKTTMEMLGHEKIDILKMDIEAAEYDVIDEIVNSGVKINQILVEFHHRFKSVGKRQTQNAIQKLNEAGYKIFSISDYGREYSFMKID